jgi:GAF domain-containing protein
MTTRAPHPLLDLSTVAVGLVLLAALAVQVMVPFLAWQALGKLPVGVAIVQFAVPYLVGLCHLAVAVWSLMRRRHPAQEKALALACAGISMLTSARFDLLTTHVLTPMWAAAWPLTAVAFSYLGFVFLSEQAQSTKMSPWRHSVLVLGVAMALWAVISLYSSDPRALLIPRLAGFVAFLGGVAAFIGALVQVRFRPSFIPLRLQARAMLTGALIAFVPLPLWVAASIVGALASGVGPSDPLRPLAYVPFLLAFPLASVYAMRRYTLPDTETVLNSFYDAPASLRAALTRITQELAATSDPDATCECLLSGIGSIFRPRHAWTFLLSPRGDQYDAFRVWAESDFGVRPSSFLTAQDKIVSMLRHDGQGVLLTPQVIGDLQLSEHEQRFLSSLSIELLIPLRSQAHLIGILALGPRPSSDRYSRDEVLLLTAIANQAAASLERAQLHSRQIEHERRMIERTRQLAHILALGNQVKSLDRDIVVQKTVETIQSSLGYGLVILSLVEEDEPTRVRVVAWAGIEGESLERQSARSFPFVEPGSVAGAHQVGECYFVYAPDTDQQLSTVETSAPWREGDQLLVPLNSSDGLIGYLSVDRPASGLRPGEDELEVFEILANQVTIAIQNASLYTSIDRALDERVAELATLHEIDRQINLRLSFSHVMDMTLEWAMRATSAIAGTLALVSEDQQTLHVVAHRGYPPEMEQYWSGPWPIDEGLIGQVIRNAKPLLSAGLANDAGYPDSLLRTRSHLVAPITREDHVVGIINLESTEPNGFTADHLAFLMRLADHAMIAIENARLYEETSRRVAELSALQRISLDLTARLDLSAVLDSIAANSRELTRADEIAIYLYDQSQDSLVFGTGLSQRGREMNPPIPILQNRLTTTVVGRGQPIVIDSARGHPLLADVDWDVGAIASIPLRKADRVLGAFDISFKKPHAFTSDELRTLNLLADQAAIAIENAQLYAEAQRANESRDEFIGDASRVLRALITPIQGYARLMSAGTGGELSDQQQESVRVIVRNIERMDKLVSELLELARIGSAKIVPSAKPVELQKVVKEVVRSIHDETQARDQQIAVDIPRDLPGVRADMARIRQLWTQLLVTLSQHTPRGGAIRVSARPYADVEHRAGEQAWVLCAVEGPSLEIAQEEHGRVFKPFYRLNRAGGASEQGIGLGLALVRAIVEVHGGRIWVESKRGKGSTFCFTLPVSPSTSA